MQAGAGDALGEVAPVGCVQRAGGRVRTWREHMGARVDQLTPGGENALPAGRRSWFDDDERVGGHVPEPLQN
jgi:hypothetical protein